MEKKKTLPSSCGRTQAQLGLKFPRIYSLHFVSTSVTRVIIVIAVIVIYIRELKQQRRQRQGKRHLKINIWEMATIL